MTRYTDEASVQLAYLMSGIDEVLRVHKVKQRLIDCKDHPMSRGGHIGMIFDLLPYARDVAACKGQSWEHPGVFEHEVTVPLGTWMANQPEWPSLAAFKAELERLGNEFFNPSLTSKEDNHAPL